MKIFYLLLGMLFGISGVSFAAMDHSHAALTEILKTTVHDGWVDYKGLEANPTALQAYLDTLAKVTESEFQGWTEAQQVAYLVNLYNAQTLGLILQHYPLKRIKDIGSIFSGPWDQPVVRLFGKKRTLNHVEHEILRKEYDHPEVHFALVCAAKGCPPLRSEAYRPKDLEQQFTEQGKIFLGNTQKNRVDNTKRVLYLSPIFKWFKEDFTKKGTLQQFVTPYFPEKDQSALEQSDYTIKYTYYDWTLNEK